MLGTVARLMSIIVARAPQDGGFRTQRGKGLSEKLKLALAFPFSSRPCNIYEPVHKYEMAMPLYTQDPNEPGGLTGMK